MENEVSSIEEVLAAMPAVQQVVQAETARRMANGEPIGRVEGSAIIADGKTENVLDQRREAILAEYKTSVIQDIHISLQALDRLTHDDSLRTRIELARRIVDEIDRGFFSPLLSSANSDSAHQSAA